MQRKGILLAGGWGSQMGTRPLREAGLDAEMLGRGCAWPEAIAFRPGWTRRRSWSAWPPPAEERPRAVPDEAVEQMRIFE